MSKQQTAMSILADATILATGRILNERGIFLEDIDTYKLTECIKDTLKGNVDDIFNEWEQMIGLSEYQIRQAMNLQANIYGRMAVGEYLKPEPWQLGA